MKLINKLQVERFRGIRDLSISRLAQINLIVGDNNCGKTSLLEAIQLLWKPGSLTNIEKLVKRRDDKRTFETDSLFDSVVSLFSRDGKDLKIQLSCEYDGNVISYWLFGKESMKLPSVDEKANDDCEKTDETSSDKCNFFNGKSICTFNARHFSTLDVQLDRRSCLLKDNNETKELIKIHYASPFESRQESKLKRIIREEQYKESCLRALQLFDPNIEDMRTFSSKNNRSMEYLKHKQFGDMPLSSYGDGIKKVLALFNAIIGAENGVLLIDEIETSIHMKHFDDIFRFLINACKEFNVQMFITTHSIEAVDGLLNTQDYETQSSNDEIMVVTLKRVNDKTYSSVLPGREVFEDRKDFGFEVRL